MKNTDQARFAEMMHGIADYYKTVNPRTASPSNSTLKIYFQSLRDFTLNQIYQAISTHISDEVAGRFFPSIADINRHIEGESVTVEAAIAAARLAETPFGVLCRMQIGTWDLNHHDGPYLKQRAHECLQKLPGWRKRAASGDYTEQEIKTMIHCGVDPAAPFTLRVSRPRLSQAATERIKQITASVKAEDSQQKLLRKDTENTSANMPKEVKKEIADLLEMLKIPEDRH